MQAHEALLILQGNYLEARATDVDLEEKKVTCTYAKPFTGAQYNERSFSIPYDILVVAVRALLHTENKIEQHLSPSDSVSDTFWIGHFCSG